MNNILNWEKMSEKRIIALCGNKGSGKTTIANYICHTRKAVEIAFADSLKQILNLIYDIPIQYFKDPMLKEVNLLEQNIFEFNVTPRKLMQTFGEHIRNYPSNIDEIDEVPWLTIVKRKIINALKKDFSTVVISDVRHKDELLMLENISKKNGYKLIILKIERNLNINDNHISENDLNDYIWKNIVYNTGDMDTLYRRVDLFI